jgi:hypothetical protein
MRAFWVRAFVVRAGEVTGVGDDVFYLHREELLDLLRGRTDELVRVPTRRATYEHYKALPPYPALIVGHFDPVRWAADPNRRTDIYDARGETVPLSATAAGFPGTPGVVEGTTRVIAGPEEGHRLQTGDILVTTVTNVGWTPLFPAPPPLSPIWARRCQEPSGGAFCTTRHQSPSPAGATRDGSASSSSRRSPGRIRNRIEPGSDTTASTRYSARTYDSACSGPSQS